MNAKPDTLITVRDVAIRLAVPPNIALEPSAPLKDERRGSARA